MPRIEATELIQRAYNLSVDIEASPLKLPEDLLDAGVQKVHRTLYDSGLVFIPEFKQALVDNPKGPLAELVRSLIEARVKGGEYREETLKMMYGLPKDF
jgi:hypothetical protein